MRKDEHEHEKLKAKEREARTFLEIDPEELEQEKRAMLAEIRKADKR